MADKRIPDFAPLTVLQDTDLLLAAQSDETYKVEFSVVKAQLKKDLTSGDTITPATGYVDLSGVSSTFNYTSWSGDRDELMLTLPNYSTDAPVIGHWFWILSVTSGGFARLTTSGNAVTWVDACDSSLSAHGAGVYVYEFWVEEPWVEGARLYAKLISGPNTVLFSSLDKAKLDGAAAVNGIVRGDGDGGFSAAAVATGDIALGAVTGEKINAGAITDAKVSSGAAIQLSKTESYTESLPKMNSTGTDVGSENVDGNIKTILSRFVSIIGNAFTRLAEVVVHKNTISGIDGIIRGDGDGGFSAAAVATGDIALGAVTGEKIANYTITGQKLDDEIIKDTHVADDANIKLSKTKAFLARRLHANLDGSVGVGNYTDNIEEHFTDHAQAATWHVENNSIHITPSERTSWNGALKNFSTLPQTGASGELALCNGTVYRYDAQNQRWDVVGVLSAESYSAAEKTKLDGIEARAEVNVVEGVTLNGTAVNPDANKKVNIPLASEEADGVMPSADKIKLSYLSDMSRSSLTAPSVVLESDRTGLRTFTAQLGSNKVYILPKITVGLTLDGANAEAGDVCEVFFTAERLVDITSVNVDSCSFTGDSVSQYGLPVLNADQRYRLRCEVTGTNNDQPVVAVTISQISDLAFAAYGVSIAGSPVPTTDRVANIPLATADVVSGGVTADGINGAMSHGDKTKLDGIAPGAEVNTINQIRLNGKEVSPDGTAISLVTAKSGKVILRKNAWANGTQTVVFSKATADADMLFYPADDSSADYFTCGVYRSSQKTGKLTFACNTVPASDITVKVITLSAYQLPTDVAFAPIDISDSSESDLETSFSVQTLIA